MAAPTIPAAVDALVALCTASAALGAADPAVTIYDGQPLTDLPDDYVAIGIAAEDSPSVTGAVLWAAFGKVRSEQYRVACQVSSATGDTAMKPPRDRAWVLYRAVADAVLADVTLGGVVIKALVGDEFSYVQEQTGGDENSAGGAVATIDFTIDVLSHI